jgi:hypothetical protein
LATACSNSPEKIEPVNTENSGTGIFEGEHQHNHATSDDFMDAWHTVEVVELLETVKYAYLKVNEDGNEYWIATLKDNFQVGQKYTFRTSLLKTNFKSVEHNRTFNELYLVSEIMPATDAVATDELPDMESPGKAMKKSEITGLITIAEIVKNPKRYEGKTVRVFGNVVKANPNIMDRNWLHLKDGSADDYDFVLTTNAQIPEGHAVGFEGIIVLNKDFGAGYAYDIIMEDAKPLR